MTTRGQLPADPIADEAIRPLDNRASTGFMPVLVPPREVGSSMITLKPRDSLSTARPAGSLREIALYVDFAMLTPPFLLEMGEISRLQNLVLVPAFIS